MSDPIVEDTNSTVNELCYECGQIHVVLENHLYDYQDDVDDELVCHICLQPLLQPLDTPCGHTFCFKCLENFLQEQDFCPMDRKKLHLQHCRKSSLLVRNLLDKLIVHCPFQLDCNKVMQRCELDPHLQNRCPGLMKYRVKIENKRQLSLKANQHTAPDDTTVAAEGSAAAAVSLQAAEPGLVNPAFEEDQEEDVLQVHHRKQTCWMHHMVVWKLLSSRSEEATEGSECSSEHNTTFPSMDSIHISCCIGKAANVLKDPSHSGNTLFFLLAFEEMA